MTDVLNTLGTDPPGTKAVTTTGTSGKRARTDAEKDVIRAGKSLGDLPTDLTTHVSSISPFQRIRFTVNPENLVQGGSPRA